MTPDGLREHMLGNIALMKSRPLLWSQMSELQRAIVDAQGQVLAADDPAIVPYLALVCAALPPQYGYKAPASGANADAGMRRLEFAAQERGLLGPLLELLAKCGEAGKTLAALVAMIFGDAQPPGGTKP